MSTDTLNGHAQDGLVRGSRLAEQATLGALMLAAGGSADIPGQIMEVLQGGAADFVGPAHRKIYEAIVGLAEAAQPHEPLDVAGSLDAGDLARIGGAGYLLECVQACDNVLSGPRYATQVANAAALRDLAKLGALALQSASTSSLDDAGHAVDQARALAEKLRAPVRASAMQDWDTTAPQVIAAIERLQEEADNPELRKAGISTGWADLDQMLGPLPPGTQIVVAARPGVGKSVAVRNLMQHVAMRQRMPAALFGLEMGRVETGMALMSAGASVPLNLIRNGRLTIEDWTSLTRYIEHNDGAPLHIDETVTADLAYADRELTRLARLYGRPVAAYGWDYLQLSQASGRQRQNREQEVAAMSRGHKILAKKHGCVSVVLSQLNRGPEQRSDKRPQLSDLRESGSVEQDADIVILLHREDYYDEESPRAGEVDFIVAKNRSGPTGTVTMASQLHLSRFVSMAIQG